MVFKTSHDWDYDFQEEKSGYNNEKSQSNNEPRYAAYVLRCPSCNAPFDHVAEMETTVFCPFCGSPVRIIDNNVIKKDIRIRKSVKVNKTIHHVDDADIKRAEADLRRAEAAAKKAEEERIVELRRMEIAEDHRKTKMKVCIGLAIVGGIMILSDLNMSSSLSLLGVFLLLSGLVLFLLEQQKDKKE